MCWKAEEEEEELTGKRRAPKAEGRCCHVTHRQFPFLPPLLQYRKERLTEVLSASSTFSLACLLHLPPCQTSLPPNPPPATLNAFLKSPSFSCPCPCPCPVPGVLPATFGLLTAVAPPPPRPPSTPPRIPPEEEARGLLGVPLPTRVRRAAARSRSPGATAELTRGESLPVRLALTREGEPTRLARSRSRGRAPRVDRSRVVDVSPRAAPPPPPSPCPWEGTEAEVRD